MNDVVYTMTIVSLFGARRMGKSVIQRMYMEYIKEKIMNEQERALDLQLGDALAETESLKAERDALLAENEKLSDLWSLMKAERDEYQIAADKLAWENKVLRDAALAQPEQDIADILAGELQISRATAYDLMREALAKAQPEQESDDLMIAYLSGVHAGKKEAKAKQEKPWVGLTEEENHIAEVLNKTLGLQYVADKLQEKNT